MGKVRIRKDTSRAMAEELMRKRMDEREPVKVALREIEEREKEKARGAEEAQRRTVLNRKAA